MWLAAMIFAAQLGDLSAYPELARYRDLPKPVRVFIDRRMGCGHWAGEEPYDKDRAREIARAVRQLRCTQLDADERALQRRYAADEKVKAALAETRELGW